MTLNYVLSTSGLLIVAGTAAHFAQDLKKSPVNPRLQRLERPQKLPAAQPPLVWTAGLIKGFGSPKGTKAVRAGDSIVVQGARPETDSYTVPVETDLGDVHAIRIEALTLASLPNGGPGRAQNGNFVVSEVTAAVGPKGGPTPVAVRFSRAEADFEQTGFPAAHAVDGNGATGWAISGTGPWNVNRSLTLYLASPVKQTGGGRWSFKIDQLFGAFHTLGRFRILFGAPQAAPGMTIGQAGPILIPLLTLSTGDWDFETGLQGWTVKSFQGPPPGFVNQPLQGDVIQAHQLSHGDLGFDNAIKSKIGGDYWQTPVFTGYQGQRWVSSTHLDASQGDIEASVGTLTSPEFKISKPHLSCLMSGTNHKDQRVELQVRYTDVADRSDLMAKIFAERKQKQAAYQQQSGGTITNPPGGILPKPSGPPPYPPGELTYDSPNYLVVTLEKARGGEGMTRVRLDVPAAIMGRMARYKVYDYSGAGHISVDDFRQTDTELPYCAPVWGFVDTHTHPMVHMAFGGGWSEQNPSRSNSLIWGSPGGKLETTNIANDLPDCDGFTHGNVRGAATEVLEFVMRLVGLAVNTAVPHGSGGYNRGFVTWPASGGGTDDILHQQMHVQYLRRAYEGGQRILVGAAINNQLVERMTKNGFDATGNKLTTPTADGDFNSCVQQINAMRLLAAQNSSWMEVVLSPAQARMAIRNNKLALVLAVETDWLNGMEQVRQLYGMGVRHITPVHLMDNVFGSTAVYKDIFNYLNAWFHNRPFDVDDGTGLGVNFMPGRAILFPKFLFNIPTVPGFATGADLFRHGYTQTDGLNSPHKFAGYINKWGLDNYVAPLGGAPKPDARSMYKEMMRLGMLIDIAHMSHRSVENILDMTNPDRKKGGNGYPVSSSHGGIRELSEAGHANERSLTESQCREVLALGGTLGLGIGPESGKTAGSAVPNDAPGTTKSFGQVVQGANALFNPASRNGGLTLGSDFNGLNGMMRPRFGPKAKSGGQTNGVRYILNSSGAPFRNNQPPMQTCIINGQSGPRFFDFNVDGLAHAGLVPDMFQDARNVGLPPAQIGTFFRGAEDFIRMWEKCERLRGSIP